MEIFALKNIYAFGIPIHKIDFIKYSRSSLATINNNNSNFSICFPREDVYVCLQNAYISLELEVFKNNNTRYIDNDQTSLVNFGPIALFSEAKLVTSSGSHLEKVDNLHTVCLMYKLLTSNQQTRQVHAFLNGFEESENREEKN